MKRIPRVAHHRRIGRSAMETFTTLWSTEPRRTPEHADAPRFLILNHFYDQDIDAYLRASLDCGIWVLDWQAVNGIREFYGPTAPSLEVDSNGPVMAPQTRAAKRYFVRDAVAQMIRDVRPDAVITPSSIFFWFRPFIEEFQAAGIPVITQDKEGTLVDSPIIDDVYAMVLKNYPQDADAYFFWGPVQADTWAKVGMERSRMRQLGMPRSDFFRHPDRFPKPSDLGLPDDKPLVTFFTYEANVYLKLDTRNLGIDRPWLTMRQETHRELVRFAQARPDVHVVVKCHPQSPEVTEISHELASDVPNLTIMTGAATAASLIVLSDVVVGFQTTALIEAMLTDKPIIYTAWAEEHARFYPILIPLLESGACFAPESPEAFRTLLEDVLDRRQQISPRMLENRETFAARYFVDPDGTTADRVLKQIVAEFIPRLVEHSV